MILRFANCELDLARIVLRRDGEDVKLEPQAFDVLAYLVQHRGTVVRKEELLDEVWGDRFVSESALTTRIKAVRQAVDDDGNRQAIIRTVHGKGYEFIAPVETVPGTVAVAGAAVPTIAGLETAIQPLIGRDALLARARRRARGASPHHAGRSRWGRQDLASVSSSLAPWRPGYSDGVHVVELVSVVDEEATSAAFATAIDVNVRRGSSIDDAIVEMLRPRHSLLLLDNCEHLIEPVAALVSRILSEAPAVSIVATSREPLAVAGEQVWSVEPLSTAAPETEISCEAAMAVPAVALFVARARAADPTFVFDERPPAWSSRSAGVSTGSRSPSSWPRPGPARSTSPRSPSGSTSGSACSRRCGAAATRATARCATRSAGPTTCSSPTSRSCSRRSRCSPGRSTCGRRKRSARAATRSTC